MTTQLIVLSDGRIIEADGGAEYQLGTMARDSLRKLQGEVKTSRAYYYVRAIPEMRATVWETYSDAMLKIQDQIDILTLSQLLRSF